MPGKNTIKNYAKESYYHVYNRGVEKRRIFEDREDYQMFLKYLELYLTPVNILTSKRPLPKLNILNHNLAEEVKLICFCLMPNHFHLLLRQETKDGITRLMRQISTAYSMYFNNRYGRLGPLFQGIYKAVKVENEDYLLHLSRYIHRNPLGRGVNLRDFQWSSYTYYILGNPPVWLHPELIMDYLKSANKFPSYENFVEMEDEKLDTNITLDNLMLET